MDNAAVIETLASIGVGTVSPPLHGGPFPLISPRDNLIFDELLALTRPSLLIEFGSWEGSSALAWCTAADRVGGSLPLILCVDTWLGSSEHWMNDLPNSEWSRERLSVESGNPRVFATFQNAVGVSRYQGSVIPFRTTTVAATEVLERLDVRADLVYVDAGHDTKSVLNDLALADRLVTDEGVILGDDWTWPSVRLAAYRFSITHCRQLHAKGNHFLVLPRHLSPAMRGHLDDPR
ncbi:class I SAM-dependent methyltransferase, partial [bacterium]|nr:class I SAM-dependent methyltransferase [bacterium]